MVGRLHAEGTITSFQELTFANHGIEQLKKIDSQHIRIRGFLYATPEGHYILAAQPNLRSCCVTTLSKADQRIEIRGLGAISIPMRPVILEGFLKTNPEYSKEGKLIGLYTLENAQLIYEKETSFFRILIIICSILLLLGLILMVKKNGINTIIK